MNSLIKRLIGLVLACFITIPVQSGTEMYFIHNDHLGTPQVVTDQSQTVVWEGKQKPFGEVEETTASIEQLSRFPGQYFDEESNLHYNYFRDYDPTIGRYIQSDPIGLAGGLNTYGYVLQNPILYIDALGLSNRKRPQRDIQYGRRGCDIVESVQCSNKCKSKGGVSTCNVDQISTLKKFRLPDDGNGPEYLELWVTRDVSLNCVCRDEDEDEDDNNNDSGGFCPYPRPKPFF